MKKRLPLNALMRSVVHLLSEVQTTPVYEYLDKGVQFPFVTFGDVEVEPSVEKVANIHHASMELVVFSRRHTRREVNGILDDLSIIFSSVRLDMSDEKFAVMTQEIESVTTSPSEREGYEGIIRISFEIQDMEV